jgi:hypothetical protein
MMPIEVRWSNLEENLLKRVYQPEESGYAVYSHDGGFAVFSWTYGGMEKFEGVFETLNEAIETAESWT